MLLYAKTTMNNAVTVSVNTTPKGKTEHYHLQLICASQIMIHYTVEERILTRVHFYTCIIKIYVEDIKEIKIKKKTHYKFNI